jgi:hypothetical protein
MKLAMRKDLPRKLEMDSPSPANVPSGVAMQTVAVPTIRLFLMAIHQRGSAKNLAYHLNEKPSSG